jgi:hypothetical protein
MAPTRRRKAPPPPPLDISPQALESFIGTDIEADRALPALATATAAAEAFIGAPIPNPCPHPIRQGIFLFAAQLLLLPPNSPAAEPSLVTRAMWQAHASNPKG